MACPLYLHVLLWGDQYRAEIGLVWGLFIIDCAIEAELRGSDNIIDLHFQRLEAPRVLLCSHCVLLQAVSCMREIVRCASKAHYHYTFLSDYESLVQASSLNIPCVDAQKWRLGHLRLLHHIVFHPSGDKNTDINISLWQKFIFSRAALSVLSFSQPKSCGPSKTRQCDSCAT